MWLEVKGEVLQAKVSGEEIENRVVLSIKVIKAAELMK